MTAESQKETESAAQHVFIARQPIFDAGNRRVAYELLYRDSRTATDAGRISADMMCSDTALHAVVSIGLDRLTGGATAFVNLTRDHFLGELHRVFEPANVVLELLESIDGDPDVVAACEQAVAAGYTLALDDYDGRPSLDTLLPFVKIVKLDVLNRTRDELAPTVARLKEYGLTVLAERVETGEMRAMCQSLGCSLFQGYVFARPETLGGRSLSVEQTTMLNIVSMLGDPMLVTSVGSANPVVGEAVAHALVRARFCELLTIRSGTGDPSARFLVGLLSRLDMLLGEPLEKVLERMPVTNEVRDALLTGQGPHAPVFSLALAYESADWETVDAYLGRSESGVRELGEIYSQATAWAAEQLNA